MNHLTRVGIGVDFHKLIHKVGGAIILCGVKIPCNFILDAHSDGDVALHALTDAMLGAIAKGNIGMHFPNTEEKWKNCNSTIFLQYANKLIQEANGRLVNIDMTVICEHPKIMSRSLQLRTSISGLLDIAVDQVSVKAVTTEGMGFLGRGEGIAAQVVCSVMMPYN